MLYLIASFYKFFQGYSPAIRRPRRLNIDQAVIPHLIFPFSRLDSDRLF